MHFRFAQTEASAFPPLCDLLSGQGWADGRSVGAGDAPGLDRGRNGPPGGPAVAAPRPLRDPDAAVARLADWADEARHSGRARRADELLSLAWQAYDRPARARD